MYWTVRDESLVSIFLRFTCWHDGISLGFGASSSELVPIESAARLLLGCWDRLHPVEISHLGRKAIRGLVLNRKEFKVKMRQNCAWSDVVGS